MALSKGVGSAVSWAVEPTYGTAVAPTTVFIEANSIGIVPSGGASGDPSLRSRSARAYSPKKLESGGPFETIGNYAGGAFAGALKAVMGSCTSGSVVDSTYTHTIVLAEALAGYTIEVKPDSGELTKGFQFPGCLFTKMSLSQEAEKPLMATFEVVGDGNRTQVTATTVTYPSFVGIDWDDLAVTINTVAVKILSWNLDLDNAVEAYGALGQKDAQAAAPTSRTVTGSITMLLDATTYLTIFDAMTEANIVFTYTGPLAGATTAYSLAIRVPRAVFNKDGAEITGDGANVLTMSFDAFYDVTNTVGEVQAILVNKTVSIT